MNQKEQIKPQRKEKEITKQASREKQPAINELK
jgi:hypothetical protein